MRTSVLVLWIGVCAVIAGCSVQPAPAKVSFLLNIESGGKLPTMSQGCLRLRSVQVQSPFSGIALVYRTGEVTFEKDYYNQFLVAPDKQLNDLLKQRLLEGGVTFCVEAMGTAGQRLTLEPHLQALYADFRTPAAPSAYIKMRFVLIRYDRSCRCSSILLDQTLESAVSLPKKPAAKDVVEGMSEALSNVLADFETALAQTLK